MVESTLSISIDEELKKKFNQFCNNVGMSMSTAFEMFVKMVVRNRCFPFEISTYQNQHQNVDNVVIRAQQAFESMRQQVEESDTQEPTIDEINAFIADIRSKRHC